MGKEKSGRERERGEESERRRCGSMWESTLGKVVAQPQLQFEVLVRFTALVG